MLDNLDPNIVAGEDQCKGARHSWMKSTTYYTANEIYPHSAYLVAQVAHISCKKDFYTLVSEAESLSTRKNC
jgi:hypothetical protein